MRRGIIKASQGVLAAARPLRRPHSSTLLLGKCGLLVAPIGIQNAVGFHKGGIRWNSSVPPKASRLEESFHLEHDTARQNGGTDIRAELESALRPVLDSIEELVVQLVEDPLKAEHLYGVPPIVANQILKTLRDPSVAEGMTGSRELDTDDVESEEKAPLDDLKSTVADTVRLSHQLQLRGSSVSPEEARKVLSNLGSELTHMGLWTLAVEAHKSCIKISRTQMASHSCTPALKENLVQALNNLSFCYKELHRQEDALEWMEEAVETQRGLVEEHPEAFTPGLALTLGTLSLLLSDLGRKEEAIMVNMESVEIYRKLAEENPLKFGQKVALSLNNLSNRLHDVDRSQEALEAGVEGTTILWQLVEKHPGQYEPNLAAALVNVSVDLDNAGYEEQGLLAIEKAVELYRALVQDNPMVFRPKLAIALLNLSNFLTIPDRQDEGLQAMEESVGICRELANTLPRTFSINLAQSIIHFSLFLGKTGDQDNALAMIEEAARLCQTIKEAQLPTYALMKQLEHISRRFNSLGLEELAQLAEIARTNLEG